jgi:hypothetical protein
MGLMFPKKPVGRVRGGHHGDRYENKAHMKEMRDEMSCSLAGRCECDGPVEIHHLLKPFIGTRGMGRKADDRNTQVIIANYTGNTETKTNSLKTRRGSRNSADGGPKSFGKILHIGRSCDG